MTPEEKAVIEAAFDLVQGVLAGIDPIQLDDQLSDAVKALIFSCPECNAGGHTCPGDGNPIGHTANDCGEHDEPDENQYAVEQAAELLDSPVWIETTMTNALINDRIRIGAEETTVWASTHGMWNVDNRDAWHPRAWQHVELRLELAAVPGLKQYPPAASIEILCSPERLAVLRIQEGFPG